MDIENEALVAIAQQQEMQAAQQQALQEDIEEHEINEFFRTQQFSERYQGYSITPELLDFVKRHPDIGFYKFHLSTQRDEEIDEKLKKLSEEEIRNFWEDARMQRKKGINYESYVFVKIPYSQVKKSRESKAYKRQQMQAQQNAGGGVAMDLHEDEELAAALEDLQVDEGRGGGGAIKKVKPGMFGGKSRRRKSRKSRKTNKKSKKIIRKNLKKSNKSKKSKKNKK